MITYQGHKIFYKDSIGDLIFVDSGVEKILEFTRKPVLLLLHGYPSFSYDYAAIYERFKSEFHIVAFDFLGFGVSDKPHIDYTVHIQADIAESLLGAIMAERKLYRIDHSIVANKEVDNSISIHHNNVFVIAHDFGVSVLQELLARQVDRSTDIVSSSMHPDGHMTTASAVKIVDDCHTSLTRNPNPVYFIQSAVFLNGGLFPETHYPTLVQKLLLNTFVGPYVHYTMSYWLFSKSLNEVFGPHSQLTPHESMIYWDALNYNHGATVIHLIQRYIIDRQVYRERWVGALIQSAANIHIQLINGPYDPVSGRHMAARYAELVPQSSCNVVILGDMIGHYPQLEDKDNVHKHIASHFAKSLSIRKPTDSDSL